MQKIPQKQPKYFIIILLCLFILGGQPVEFGKEKTFFHGYLIPKPIIKIGIAVNLSNIRIHSSSGMKIYEVNSNYKLIANDADEVHIKAHKEKLTEKFLIQVAETKEREKAEIIVQDLQTKIENKVYVTENTENELAGIFQVKIGDFLTRGDALNFIKKLNQLGIKETWILREEITEEESKPLWILVNNELKSLSEDTVLYFIPNNRQSFLSYNGRDYRGIFILKSSRKGVVLINILNIENYLKGVVPSELSPYDFRELEAHKAQAVAARTYAIKNLGLHDDLGFDLCDTPNSQFYKGMNAEHPLSSEAVEMTQGEVALYKGKLIDALYTSTCGGMTENVENIFGGPSRPYLKSTGCVYEKEMEWLLMNGNIFQPIQVNGRNISPIIASLISLEVIYPSHINILDRNSAFYSWQLRISREDLERRINRFYPIGELQDLIPQKRGDSKRVLELLILGTEAQSLVKGLRIRRVLGLRETLFVIDREYDEEGDITYFNFYGRGWGHGVGLCQVGTFGMARAGADYKEILKKYYHGIKIRKIY